jgi:hypothetical protein
LGRPEPAVMDAVTLGTMRCVLSPWGYDAENLGMLLLVSLVAVV